MRARSSHKADSQNLDSLLDTMANVVGILVVLVAVVQLTVNDAMKRIRVWESEEAAALRVERSEAELELASLGAANLAETLELAQLRSHLSRLLAEPAAAQPAEAEAVAASVASQRLRARRLQESLEDKENQLASLRIQLAELEAQPQPEGIELRLPDPRPAPLDTRRVVIMCRYGRVFDPKLQDLLDELERILRRPPPGVTRYFEQNDIGNREFRWRIEGGAARLDWRRRDAGETRDELLASDAVFRDTLAGYDPRRAFLQFWVWGDSFDIYLEARKLAEESGFQVGWVAHEDGKNLYFVAGAPQDVVPVD